MEREQIQDPSYDSRTAMLTLVNHSRRCNTDHCRHTFTASEARDEEMERLYEKEACDCSLSWYWLSKDEDIPSCKHQKRTPVVDTGDESGIESAGFDSNRSTSC